MTQAHFQLSFEHDPANVLIVIYLSKFSPCLRTITKIFAETVLSTGLGRFQAEPGPMDRVEGARLRSMSLPKLSREGQKAIGDNLSFVRCQLNHYGVQIEEKEFSGNGTALMKKVLQEGKCDQVPVHILEL